MNKAKYMKLKDNLIPEEIFIPGKLKKSHSMENLKPTDVFSDTESIFSIEKKES